MRTRSHECPCRELTHGHSPPLWVPRGPGGPQSRCLGRGESNTCGGAGTNVAAGPGGSHRGVCSGCAGKGPVGSPMCTPGAPAAPPCTLVSTRVFRGMCRSGTRVTACVLPCSPQPGAGHARHGILTALVLVTRGWRLCQPRAVTRVCARPPDRAGAAGRLSCLQTAGFVEFSHFIAMETVIKPHRLRSRGRGLWRRSRCRAGLAGTRQ